MGFATLYPSCRVDDGFGESRIPGSAFRGPGETHLRRSSALGELPRVSRDAAAERAQVFARPKPHSSEQGNSHGGHTVRYYPYLICNCKFRTGIASSSRLSASGIPPRRRCFVVESESALSVDSIFACVTKT